MPMYIRGVILLLAFGAACGRADRDVVVESGTRFLADEQVSAWFGEWSISGSPFLSIRQVSGGVAVIDPFDEQNWRHTARRVTFDGSDVELRACVACNRRLRRMAQLSGSQRESRPWSPGG